MKEPLFSAENRLFEFGWTRWKQCKPKLHWHALSANRETMTPPKTSRIVLTDWKWTSIADSAESILCTRKPNKGFIHCAALLQGVLIMEQTKPNFFARIANYFREVKSELKKVVWPTFKKIRQNTLIVIIYVLIVGLVIWALDMLFTWGMAFFINR